MRSKRKRMWTFFFKIRMRRFFKKKIRMRTDGCVHARLWLYSKLNSFFDLFKIKLKHLNSCGLHLDASPMAQMCDTLVFLISRGLLFLKEKCFPKLMELGNLLMAPREQPCMAHLDGHFAFSKNSFCGNILMISEPLLVITCTYVLTSMVKQSLHGSIILCMYGHSTFNSHLPRVR